MTNPTGQPRKLRADAARNRDRLLEIAREAFAREGADASLDDIAKKSGVGSATLYRHYPTRELLIEAVYQREVEELGATGAELLVSAPPLAALRTWMMTFVDHVIEKHIIASALNEAAYADASVVVQGTMERLARRAIDNGDLRPDTVPLDLLRAMIGVLHIRAGPDWRESAKRLVDILLRGASEPNERHLTGEAAYAPGPGSAR